MKRLLSIFTLLVLVTGVVNAGQKWNDETLRYALYLGPIKAGEASLVTKNTVLNGQNVVRLELIARTTSAVEKIFSMNDTLTSYIDTNNTNPVYFRKHCFEGDDVVEEFAWFSYTSNGNFQAKMRKNYKDGRVKERTEASDVPVYDMISVVGYAKVLDTSGMQAGKHIDFRLVDAAEIIDECLIFQGRETLKVSGKRYSCLTFKLVEPYLEKGKTKFKDILTIYVSDDESRTIVQMDIKFKVGSAKAKIIG